MTSQIKAKRTRRTRDATTVLRDTIVAVLAEMNPMTVRQVYYQLVARHLIENKRTQYQATCDLLVKMRLNATVPWAWIEDRNRRPRQVQMWDDLGDFLGAVRQSYRRDVWAEQSAYVEVWLEKDALSGIFEDALEPYGVTLNVGRGYDGWDSIHNAAVRLGDGSGATILYFGDFDPSGEDMFYSLQKRLATLGCAPLLVKCALTLEDVQRYNLPPELAKKSDTRAPAFVDKWGDVSVELDALPATVLRQRLITEVEARIDLDALGGTRRAEAADIARLNALLDKSG
jgi:hypothetical protein